MTPSTSQKKYANSNPKGTPGKNRRRTLVWGVGILVLTVAAYTAFPYLCLHAGTDVVVRIPKNATMENVRDTLHKYFDEKFADHTLTAAGMLGLKPDSRHGAYLVKASDSPLTAGKTLARGAQQQIDLTINGVREFDPFIGRIAAKFDFSADSLRAVLYSPEFLVEQGLTKAQVPALFLNDKYYFYWSNSPGDVAEKIAGNYNAFWTPERKDKAASLGLTPAEIVTLASIVDEETNAESEKGRIGRLYINRLQKGMKLQADPTVRFALGDFSIRRITGAHLQAPGPYNTYRVEGLPPGPIRTTSTKTIDAILNSNPSTDIYMCASEDFSGTHRFAESYTEHLENARRYQKALDARGIK